MPITLWAKRFDRNLFLEPYFESGGGLLASGLGWRGLGLGAGADATKKAGAGLSVGGLGCGGTGLGVGLGRLGWEGGVGWAGGAAGWATLKRFIRKWEGVSLPKK